MDRAREIAEKWIAAQKHGYDQAPNKLTVAKAYLATLEENAKLKAVVQAARRISLSHNYATASERIEQLNHALRELDAGVGK